MNRSSTACCDKSYCQAVSILAALILTDIPSFEKGDN
jgi:hypothetical protein